VSESKRESDKNACREDSVYDSWRIPFSRLSNHSSEKSARISMSPSYVCLSPERADSLSIVPPACPEERNGQNHHAICNCIEHNEYIDHIYYICVQEFMIITLRMVTVALICTMIM